MALYDHVVAADLMEGGTLRTSRFELAPPRHFVLPAILLLLSEEPSYGYRLVADLEDLGFGRVDRPVVYRALGQLERDALVESWSDGSVVGRTRRVYRKTPLGARVQRSWMEVIRQHRDALDGVLRRYQSSGIVDAVLAESNGAWIGLHTTWASMTPSPATPGPNAPTPTHRARGPVTRLEGPQRFRLIPARSILVVDVRSTAGPITFSTPGITGSIDAEIIDGVARPASAALAHIEVPLDGLRSGRSLYDAELLRRIDARRYPTATVDVTATTARPQDRYRATAQLTFHGLTRTVEGTINTELTDADVLKVTSEHTLDIRDFNVTTPTTQMLRIFPDTRTRLHLEAEPQPQDQPQLQDHKTTAGPNR